MKRTDEEEHPEVGESRGPAAKVGRVVVALAAVAAIAWSGQRMWREVYGEPDPPRARPDWRGRGGGGMMTGDGAGRALGPMGGGGGMGMGGMGMGGMGMGGGGMGWSGMNALPGVTGPAPEWSPREPWYRQTSIDQFDAQSPHDPRWEGAARNVLLAFARKTADDPAR